MSLKQKLISAFASALVVGVVGISAHAQDPAAAGRDGAPAGEKHDRRGFGRHGDFRGKGMRRGPAMRELRGIELTDAQKEQIRQIHEANRPDQATMDELKSLGEARRGGTLTDEQKARVQTLHDQMKIRAESVHQQVLAVLTPEQRQQIETRKAEMKKRMEERRQLRQQQRQQATPPATKTTEN